MIFLTLISVALALPGEKRTILTSGERVHTIHYQLGQSTVIYFGMKPETVICGNKNYFNIEKIKEGITIQPLSNFSTNLTVMSPEKRYLFYLTPAKGAQGDTFVDVKWIPEAEVRPADVEISAKQTVREINQKLSLKDISVWIKREIRIKASSRTIFEVEVLNASKVNLKSSEIEIIGVKAGRAVKNQTLIFEQEDAPQGSKISGRLILTEAGLQGVDLKAAVRGISAKLQVKGAPN